MMGTTCSKANETIAVSAPAKHLTTTASIISDLEVPIYFINFKSLLARDEFPRYPEDKGLAVSVADIDVSQSLLVFVSHCWARGWSGAEGWDGRPHPDDMHHSKMALCKKGIHKLWKELAPECKDCYVWLDFGCINQDGSPCAELKQLDKIIQFCDCVFTPIVEDEEDIDKYIASTIENNDHLQADQSAVEGEDQQDEIAKHYHSKKWNGDEHAYLNRGWTRVEMFYASAIPFMATETGMGAESESELEQACGIGIKFSKFKAGLHSAVSNGRRPQFVYGSYQMRRHLPMRVLPPLLHSYFHRYHPMNGNLSVSSDRDKIITLVDELMPFLKFAVASYDGSYNSSNKREGLGKCTYENGDVYKGDFVNGERDGTGTYDYSDGCRYEGEWKGDKENGFGVFTYACGDVYTGQMQNGQFHGRGEIVSVRGRRLKGLFERDKYVGESDGVDEEELRQSSQPPPSRFERALSLQFVVNDEGGGGDEGGANKMGFDCDLSCSSGGSDDFDSRLSLASYD